MIPPSIPPIIMRDMYTDRPVHAAALRIGRARAITRIRSQLIAQEFWRSQAEAAGEAGYSVADPRSVGRAFFELGAKLLADPRVGQLFLGGHVEAGHAV